MSDETRNQPTHGDLRKQLEKARVDVANLPTWLGGGGGFERQIAELKARCVCEPGDAVEYHGHRDHCPAGEQEAI